MTRCEARAICLPLARSNSQKALVKELLSPQGRVESTMSLTGGYYNRYWAKTLGRAQLSGKSWHFLRSRLEAAGMVFTYPPGFDPRLSWSAYPVPEYVSMTWPENGS